MWWVAFGHFNTTWWSAICSQTLSNPRGSDFAATSEISMTCRKGSILKCKEGKRSSKYLFPYTVAQPIEEDVLWFTF